MNKFYLTFGQKSPFRHGYVLIIAKDYEAANDLAHDVFGPKFSFIRTQEDVDKVRNNEPSFFDFFPAGQIGETLYA